jgi:hypothetical protein
MTEHDAREVLLVRALETTEGTAAFTADDRRHASKAALELARWQSAERRQALSPDAFLAKRAELLTGKLVERQPKLLRAARLLHWPQWLGVVLPLAALIFGALSEQIADRARVNLLAFPLLVIVAWNLVVYLALLFNAAGAGRGRLPWVSRRMADAAARRAGALGASTQAFMAFATDYTRATAPLMGARLARVLHFSAALFAVGAVAALYLRGLVFEYRVGWESTFLDAPTVQRWLALLLAPASLVTGLAPPSLPEVEALRFSSSGPGGPAARWIHLYAATVALFVLLPRLVLAAVAWLQERSRAQRLPLDLNEPYFRRLLGGLSSLPSRLRVLPYSYTPDETAVDGLRAVARQLLGDETELLLRPAVTYGDEERAASGLRADDAQVALTLVLVSLAATPEHENHGALLAQLAKSLSQAPAVLVDESAYARRLGPGSDARLGERRSAWRAFCEAHGTAMASVDLTALDRAAQDALERDLARALAGRVAT